MASAEPNLLSVDCPNCGAHYDIPRTMSGKRGRCAQCKAELTVPSPAAVGLGAATRPAARPAASPSPLPNAEPEYVGFECHLCSTRMYAEVRYVGRKMKCADCGALTKIPPPPPPKRKNMPAALEGEQYELWDADVQPTPSELIAHQPKYIAINCSKCATLMYAKENQVGHTITCPDCNTDHVVPPPPKRKAKKSVLASDAETPRLDPAAHPGERIEFIPPPQKKMVYEELQEAAYQEAVEKSRRTGKPMEIDSRGRPVMPRWPLITGVLPFLFSVGVPIRWLALSSGLWAAGSILLYGLEIAMSGGFGAIAGMCFFALGSGLTAITGSAAASGLLAVVTESSEGNRQIQYWPGVQDWFGDSLVVVVATMVSALPGYLVAQLVPNGESFAELWIAGSIVLCLPIVLLSQLDHSSPWGILSGRVLGSLMKCPISWLLFYLEIGVLAAMCGALAWYASSPERPVAVWPVPVYLVALFLAARLLGRLGWRLAEAIPPRDRAATARRGTT